MNDYRRVPASRRSKQNSAKPLAAALLLVFIIVGIILAVRGCNAVDETHYAKGVYVNTVDMSLYTKEEGEAQITAWAASLLRAEYTFTYAGNQWVFRPADMNAAIETETTLQQAWDFAHIGSASERSAMRQRLETSPQSLYTALSYDEEKLNAFIDDIAKSVYVEAVNAEIVADVDKPIVTRQSQTGLALNRDELHAQLLSLLESGSEQTTFVLPVDVTEPALSTDAATGGLEVIVQYSTDTTTSSAKRLGNVRLALSNFNGLVVYDGDVLNFNEIVGSRTETRGYVRAPSYYGTNITSSVGGGVCQASSTLYGAAMYAGFTAIQRHKHSMTVGYCQASLDAAVSEDADQNLIIANNTGHAVYLYASVTDKEATIIIYGVKPEYRIDIQSTITQDDIVNSRKRYIEDTEGEYVTYTDQTYLKTKGKLGRVSNAHRLYYDWDTGALIKDELLSEDKYYAQADVYYVGVQKR